MWGFDSPSGAFIIMKTIHLVAGLAFGDEGKGATVDYLCRAHNADLVVRYNGGPQAAHNVVLSDGTHHTFAQFGSGSLIPGVRTHLSRFMLINPTAMILEHEHLLKLGITAMNRTTIDEECVIVTPYHRAVNRILEHSRGPLAHGSCGMGVGRARQDQLENGDKVLFAGDLKDRKLTEAKLHAMRLRSIEAILPIAEPAPKAEVDLLCNPASVEWILDSYKEWNQLAIVVKSNHLRHLFKGNEDVVFEGAQGVLLDETHGTAPYNTWTDTTYGNALKLIAETNHSRHKVRRIGCLRAYFTRHGNGPFPTEDPWIGTKIREPHNGTGAYQGPFRYGHFDLDLATYALHVIGGVHEIFLSHVDDLYTLLPAEIRSEVTSNSSDASVNKDIHSTAREYVRRLEELLPAPIGVISVGPSAENRIEWHATDGRRSPFTGFPLRVQRTSKRGQSSRRGREAQRSMDKGLGDR
jgi:adenylosuccinate synthase